MKYQACQQLPFPIEAFFPPPPGGVCFLAEGFLLGHGRSGGEVGRRVGGGWGGGGWKKKKKKKGRKRKKRRKKIKKKTHKDSKKKGVRL